MESLARIGLHRIVMSMRSISTMQQNKPGLIFQSKSVNGDIFIQKYCIVEFFQITKKFRLANIVYASS